MTVTTNANVAFYTKWIENTHDCCLGEIHAAIRNIINVSVPKLAPVTLPNSVIAKIEKSAK